MLGVRVTRVDPWVVVRVSGEVDMGTAPELRRALVSQMTDGVPRVLVDLGGVDLVDSTGLGVLLGALVRARRRGGDLRVVGLSGRIADLFDLVGLRAVFCDGGDGDHPLPDISDDGDPS